MMSNWGLALLRWALGAVFIAHGLPKVMPIWGGSPVEAAALLETLGVGPGEPMALGLGVAEVAAGAALVAGAFTAWCTLLLLADVGFLVWKVHYPHGFFLNWSLENGAGHGVEYHLVLAAGLLCLTLAGAGAFSVDLWRVRAAEAEAAGLARLRRRSSEIHSPSAGF